MIRFILNEKEVVASHPPGMVLLDFIRYHQHLMGTKIGCREGDCGACTVLVGELTDSQLRYRSMTCCLMPLGNAAGKHIVTIEGINPADRELNPIQQAMTDEGATQCGFCTPGFVISLAGFCLDHKKPSYKAAIAAIDGNICRCTGYKSIERAAAKITDLLKDRDNEEPTSFVSRAKLLPAYFSTIKARLQTLTDANESDHLATGSERSKSIIVGGGTDLYVQRHDTMVHSDIRVTGAYPGQQHIALEGDVCTIGPGVTVSDLAVSPIIQEAFPEFPRYMKLVSSTPIRNMATIAGNFINASPIGDFTIFFLALDAQLELSTKPESRKSRTMPLRRLYKGYKQLDMLEGEYIRRIMFRLPARTELFHFEKVSKRMHLDIATVNTAIHLRMMNDTIKNAGLSAGGVGPVPLFLQKTSEYLTGKSINRENILEAINIAQTEISPISDARGTKEYKRLLLTQLLKAHFISLFPINEKLNLLENG
ncbi:MAG: FAD binding domain-containing protein [Chitinophagaceae bacterium]|nr:FAD binding domain-containing protein [Chitinophagaceae bacterium]